MNQSVALFLSVVAAVSAADAAPIDLVVDPTRSSIDLTMEVDVGVASDTDSDSSTLSGDILLELDEYTNPSALTLHDLMVVIDTDLIFNWSFGFLGSADALLSGASIAYAIPGSPIGPVPMSFGSFSILDVPVQMQGVLDVNYDIFLVGSGSETSDLADQGIFSSPMDGSVSIENGVITLTSSLPLDSSTPLTDADGNQLGTLTITGSATIVATANTPSCPADLNGDGSLDFFDISAFLGAFSAMDPVADFDGNGAFDFFDVSSFLNAFTTGCP